MGSFWHAISLTSTLATHYIAPPPFFSYPKYLPSFVLCLNDASDHEVKAERSSVTKYGLFPIGSNCTSFCSFKCRAPLLSSLIPQRWVLFFWWPCFFSGKCLLCMMNENAIKCLFSFLHLLNSIASSFFLSVLSESPSNTFPLSVLSEPLFLLCCCPPPPSVMTDLKLPET